jgi:hypothetical protein
VDHPFSISDFAFSFRRREGTTRDLIERSTDSPDRGSSHGKPERDREPNSGRSNRGSDRSRTIYRGRNREYSLRQSEVRTLTELGKFRVVPADDLARFGYDGDRSQMESGVRNLARQGLVEAKTIEGHTSYKRSVAFARKVVEKKHASSKEYLRHGRVFHLFSRNLYEAIGRENVRFRRVHSTEYIRTRLIALDFILRNLDFKYLESEDQKLSFFCDQLGIDKKMLPHKRYSGAIKANFTDHYFVDKFPMHYNPAASVSPVVTFSFIDPGFESMDSFRTHMDAYLNLFTKLQSLNFHYIATRDTNFERATKVFHAAFQRLWNPDGPSGLLHYFRTRRTWDDKDYDKLSNDDITLINDGKERFGSPELENLYRNWRAGEITENALRSESLKFRTPSQVSLIFSIVNGQTALFERHPHWQLNIPVKSSDDTSFTEDFTSGFSPGRR